MTQAHSPDARPADRLLAAPTVKLRLGAACCFVLAAGALLAPRSAQTALSTPQERAAPLLEERVQLQEAALPFKGVQDAARRVRDYGVGIPRVESRPVATMSDFSALDRRSEAAGFGVFVSDTHVLTHAGALAGRSSVQVSTAEGRVVDARVTAYEPSTGLVLLQTDPSGRAAVTFASTSPDPGALAVAVGHWDGREVAVPVFFTSISQDRYTVSATDGAVLAGMPLYSLEGELLAIAAGDGRAFPVRGATSRLIARASSGERQASFGLSFQEIVGDLRRAFGEKGVLITQVVPTGPADQAGILPGDALLAVGEAEVGSTETAAGALAAAALERPTTLRLLRDGRVRTLNVVPATAYAVADLVRRSSDDPSGPEARALFPAPLLERAGVPAAARVMRVNGRIVSSRAAAQRELRRRQPVILLVRHEGDRFFAALEAAR